MENKLEILKSIGLRLKYIGYAIKRKSNHEPFMKVTEIPSTFYRNSSCSMSKMIESSQIYREKGRLKSIKN